jgi:ABC-type amino acid transport substrate-binding protein
VDDLRKYRIGVVSKDLSEQLLKEMGIMEKNIDRVASGETNLMKLNRGRIDLWNYEASVAKWIISKSGFRVEDYEVVYVLRTELSSHYAFHRDTDDGIIKKFQNALDALKKKPSKGKESEYEKIIKNYINNASARYPVEKLSTP